MDQAVNVYRCAMEVRTCEHLPYQWARTQENLAILLHDHLSRFDETLEINLALAGQESPDVKAMTRLVENFFTCTRFGESIGQIQKFRSIFAEASGDEMANPQIQSLIIYLDAFETANRQWFLDFFTALSAPDRDSILTGLQKLSRKEK